MAVILLSRRVSFDAARSLDKTTHKPLTSVEFNPYGRWLVVGNATTSLEEACNASASWWLRMPGGGIPHPPKSLHKASGRIKDRFSKHHLAWAPRNSTRKTEPGA